MMTKTIVAFVMSLAFVVPALAQHAAHQNSDATGVEVRGTINSIEPDVVNVTHDPVPEIGWPAMTMDIKVVEGADLEEVKPGEAVVFTLEKGSDGLYGITKLQQAD